MPDIQTRENQLLIDLLFIDGDTRRVTLKNPKNEITTDQIKSLEAMILNGGTSTLLIGDRADSPFRRINKVTRRKSATTTLDLNVRD